MLADRLKTLQPSPTLAMQARAKAMRAQGINVISFGAGEPDFDTPRRIKDAAIRALESGHSRGPAPPASNRALVTPISSPATRPPEQG